MSNFKLDTSVPQTLAGRLAIVTGATRGIGLEITLTLASMGCSILGTYHTSLAASDRLTTLINTHTKYVGVSADITTPHISIPAITTALTTSFPGKSVDILINNAAIATLGSVSSLTAESLTSVFTGNTIFPALLLQSLLPHLSRTGTGRIINISSEGSHLGRKNTSAYSASKAALESLTRTWAQELGREYGGLTSNALALGMVATDLWAALPEDRKKFWEGKVAQEVAVAGRIGGVSDIAGVVAFLAGDSAGWVSGQVIAVGGGNLMIV